jgi:hypothetical protein
MIFSYESSDLTRSPTFIAMSDMNYWRHPGKMSVGTNWTAVRKVGRVIGCVLGGLIFVLLPLPFGRFSPYGSWLFWVGQPKGVGPLLFEFCEWPPIKPTTNLHN